MTPKLTVLVFGLSVLSLLGDEVVRPPAQVTSTEHFDFAPGGIIRVDGSYGDLYVEGWDQEQVEMTVTKLMPYGYEPKHPERAAEHMEAVRIVAERRSPSELTISTTLPPRLGFLWHPAPPTNTSHVGIEYRIHVPRNSRLMIHHGVGSVSVSGVTGDIEAACHRGDIVVWLPGTGAYSIDAKSKLGNVYSDFAGASFSQFLVGQKFTGGGPAPTQRLKLRVGFGGITIKPILLESEAKRPLPASLK